MIKFYGVVLSLLFVVSSCSNDDDPLKTTAKGLNLYAYEEYTLLGNTDYLAMTAKFYIVPGDVDVLRERSEAKNNELYDDIKNTGFMETLLNSGKIKLSNGSMAEPIEGGVPGIVYYNVLKDEKNIETGINTLLSKNRAELKDGVYTVVCTWKTSFNGPESKYAVEKIVVGGEDGDVFASFALPVDNLSFKGYTESKLKGKITLLK